MSDGKRFVCQGCGCIIDMHDSDDWSEHFRWTLCCRADVKYMLIADMLDLQRRLRP